MDYIKDISIDRGNLHLEFEKQGNLMFEYSEKLSQTEKTVNDLKDKIAFQKESIDSLKSNISLKYRSGEIAVSFKITEGALEELVNSDIEVKTQTELFYSFKKELNESIERRDTLYGMVEALRHKKTSLENLSTLFLANYFSQPKERTAEDIRTQQRMKLNQKGA